MVATDDDVRVSDVVLQSRGDVSVGERGYAREKMSRIRELAPGPVLFTRVELMLEPDPARDRRASAKAEFDLSGSVVRARAAATTMFAAVDALEGRIRQQFERRTQRDRSKALRLRGDSETAWRHGAMPTLRPPWFPRPAEERTIVRRKTFGVSALTVDDAVANLELLDHDFYLFRNSGTGEDNVVARSPDGGYELIEPSRCSSSERVVGPVRPSALVPAVMTTDGAVELLNLGDEPFVSSSTPAAIAVRWFTGATTVTTG